MTSKAIAHLKPKANTGPGKCSRRSLRHTLKDQVDHVLGRQDETGDVAHSGCYPRGFGYFLLPPLYQLSHVYLSRGWILHLGRKVGGGELTSLASEKLLQDFQVGSDKFCIARLEAVVGGVPQSLGRGGGRSWFVGAFGRRWLGWAVDRQILRRS